MPCISDWNPVAGAAAYFQVSGIFAGIIVTILAILLSLGRHGSGKTLTICLLVLALLGAGVLTALFGRIAGSATDLATCKRVAGEMAVYGGLLASVALLLVGSIVSLIVNYLQADTTTTDAPVAPSQPSNGVFDHEALRWFLRRVPLIVVIITTGLVAIRVVDYLDIWYGIRPLNPRPTWVSWLPPCYVSIAVGVFLLLKRRGWPGSIRAFRVALVASLLAVLIAAAYPVFYQYTSASFRQLLPISSSLITVATSLLLPIPAMFLLIGSSMGLFEKGQRTQSRGTAAVGAVRVHQPQRTDRLLSYLSTGILIWLVIAAFARRSPPHDS